MGTKLAVSVLLTVVLVVGCAQQQYLMPSSLATWPVVEQRARIDMTCRTVRDHQALARGVARTSDSGRHYHEFWVVGCDRTAIYRAYFHSARFSFTWPPPAQGVVDGSRTAEAWTEEVELVGDVRPWPVPARGAQPQLPPAATPPAVVQPPVVPPPPAAP